MGECSGTACRSDMSRSSYRRTIPGAGASGCKRFVRVECVSQVPRTEFSGGFDGNDLSNEPSEFVSGAFKNAGAR